MIAPVLLFNDKFIVVAGVSAFDVNILVVSEKAIVESDVAATVNDTASPAPTDPKLPDEVVQDGPVLTVKIAVAVLTAPPSLFSTLTK